MIESGDEMDKESIEMVGFSVLGGNAGLQGPYELVLDEVYATNDIDVDWSWLEGFNTISFPIKT